LPVVIVIYTLQLIFSIGCEHAFVVSSLMICRVLHSVLTNVS